LLVGLAAASLALPRRFRRQPRACAVASVGGSATADSNGGGTVSQLDAFFALVKSNLGPGLLALPCAFAHTGWVLGLPVLLITVLQGVYTMLTLAGCKRALNRPGIFSVGEVAHCALGTWGRRAADVFVFVVQGGVCCCFVDLVSGNLVQVFRSFSHTQVMLALVPVFAGMGLLREVAQLGGLNKLGSLAMVTAVVAGTVAGTEQILATGTSSIVAAALPNRPLQDSVMLAASVFFAFEGLGLVLPVEKEMRNQEAFPKVVILASSFLTVVFLGLTFTCGVAFRGELETASLMAFLATRASGAWHKAVLSSSNLLVTAAVIVTLPLQLLPASQILSHWLGRAKERLGLGTSGGGAAKLAGLVPMWVLQRLALVAGCVGASMMVSNVALLVSLFGAVGQTGLGMLTPICHLALMRKGNLPWSNRGAAIDVFVITFCVIVMVSGTFMAMSDIVASSRSCARR